MTYLYRQKTITSGHSATRQPISIGHHLGLPKGQKIANDIFGLFNKQEILPDRMFLHRYFAALYLPEATGSLSTQRRERVKKYGFRLVHLSEKL